MRSVLSTICTRSTRYFRRRMRSPERTDASTHIVKLERSSEGTPELQVLTFLLSAGRLSGLKPSRARLKLLRSGDMTIFHASVTYRRGRSSISIQEEFHLK